MDVEMWSGKSVLHKAQAKGKGMPAKGWQRGRSQHERPAAQVKTKVSPQAELEAMAASRVASQGRGPDRG